VPLSRRLIDFLAALVILGLTPVLTSEITGSPDISNSNGPATNGKPDRPYEGFPLFPHATKRWAKKIRGKLRYFGPWDKPDEALAKYAAQCDDLHAGRTPGVQADGLTVRDLLNHFLTSKTRLVESGELAKRTLRDYKDTADRIARAFGLTRLVENLAPEAFERLRAATARTFGPVALGNEVQRVRSVFKYAFDADLVERPVRFGPAFKRTSRKTLRKERHARGKRMFEPAQLRAAVGAAGVQLKAMLLLGINCGFGNADCGTLPLSALDLEGGWVNFPRPKTGITRRCPLWPETAQALRAVLDTRATPRDPAAADLVFLTKRRGSWWKDAPDNPISKETAKLLRELGVHRPGLNF
jgi:integrase